MRVRWVCRRCGTRSGRFYDRHLEPTSDPHRYMYGERDCSKVLAKRVLES